MTTPTPEDHEISRLLELAAETVEVDRSAKAQARAAMRSAYIEAVKGGDGVVVDQPRPQDNETGVAELLRIPKPVPSSSRRWRAAALVAAAAAVATAVFVPQGDPSEVTVVAPETSSSLPSSSVPTTVTATTEPPPDPAVLEAAEAIGIQFMQARAAYDGDALVSLMASDAIFSETEFAQAVEELPLQAEWERALGWQYTDLSCSATSPSFVLCTYTIQAPLNERMGKGPYSGNSFSLVIEDGEIAQVTRNLNTFEFYTDTEVQFFAWLSENYPDDFDIMNAGDRLLGGDYPSFPHLTPESIQLWEERTAEYLATLG